VPQFSDVSNTVLKIRGDCGERADGQIALVPVHMGDQVSPK
jgi:hypothetical protein